MKIKEFIKSFLPRSLFYRSLLILTVPIILTMSISTYIFFDRHWEKMAGRLALGVAGEIQFILIQVERGIELQGLDRLTRDSLQAMQLNIQYRENVKIPEDREEYFGRGDVIRKILYKELRQKVEYPFRIIVDVQEKWFQVQIQVGSDVLIVTSPERRLFSSSGYVFLLWMLSISIILMVVAILFMRNQIRPIKKLAIAADRFGKGRDVMFFKPEGSREVRQAARAFIGMRDRMQNQIQERTLMLAGVSHDLRTPLTRLKLQAEMIENEEERLAIKSDIADMERMISAYLEFAKGEGSETPVRVNIGETLQQVIENFPKENQTIDFICEVENFDIYIRPVAFERCVNNVISNALKFSDYLVITIKEGEDQIIITFDDDGPGIDPSLYNDVFKPFYREEKSRNQKTGGVGLGLPITRDIILAHGGTIELSKSPLGGLRVIMFFPN